jgi:hypothetical protein
MAMLPRLALALVLVAALIAGCGGDGDGDDEGATTGAADGTATERASTGVDEATAALVQELIPIARQPQLGKSMKESLKIADAQAELLTIAGENPAAIEPLLVALEKPDYDRIIAMHAFYIQLGKPGSERVIGEALQQLEPSPTNNTVVFAYLGSGNSKLVQAARQWAADNSYSISGTPVPVAGGWSSAGVYGPGGGVVPKAPPPSP